MRTDFHIAKFCAHQRSRVDHLHLGAGGLLGSIAESVVRKASVPVMVTPATFREIESIGMAYDGSRPAEGALRLAVELSHTANWPLTAIIVSNDHQQASNLTAKVEASIDETGIDGEIIILKGKEEAQIMNFIREGSVELMVMGAYGHNRLRELLLGSTTSNIIRHSPIPVLLTREGTRT